MINTGDALERICRYCSNSVVRDTLKKKVARDHDHVLVGQADSGSVWLAVAIMCMCGILATAAYANESSSTDSEKILLTFPDNVRLKTVIDYVGVRLGKNIIYDESLANRTLTIRSTVPVNKDQLLALLRSTLRFRGLALVETEQEGWLKIVPAENLSEEVTHQLLYPSGSPGANSVVTRLIKLKHVPAGRFTGIVNTLLSKPGGNMFELPDGHTLVVTDYKTVVDALLQLQEYVDTPRYQQHWKIYRLKNVPVGEIIDELKVLVEQTIVLSGKQDATAAQLAVPLPWINAVLLRGTAEQIEQVESLIDIVDIPRYRRDWKIYRLKNVPVNRIMPDLKSLIGQTITMPHKGDDTGADRLAVPIPWIKAIALRGTAEQIEQVESLIEMLDTPVSISTHIYPLKNTGAQRAAAVLKQVTSPWQQNAKSPDEWIITVDEEANALIVTCPDSFHPELKRWITDQIDTPSEGTTAGLSTRVFQVKYARASELISALKSVFAVYKDYDSIQLDIKGGVDTVEKPQSQQPQPPSKDKKLNKQPIRPLDSRGSDRENLPAFNMTAHEATNSIIATGPAQMLAQLERLIQRLDHHRPQVLIDVTIVSIKETKTFDLGIEIQHLRAKGGTLDQGLLTSFGLLDIDASTGTSTAKFGAGINAVLLRPNEVSVILRAFRSRLNGRVIARPQLMIDDNATGHLNSIEEQPFTSINAGQTVSTTSFAGYAEAGTQLTLTPHISEGNIVHLKYEIRSSSFIGASADANIPPPRATDLVRSQVAIPSGFVLLVGGLTRENQQKSRSEVPLLADIPILGELFRVRSDSTSKSVLYIFLRPVILREDRFAYLKYVSGEALKKAKIAPGIPVMEMEFLK